MGAMQRPRSMPSISLVRPSRFSPATFGETGEKSSLSSSRPCRARACRAAEPDKGKNRFPPVLPQVGSPLPPWNKLPCFRARSRSPARQRGTGWAALSYVFVLKRTPRSSHVCCSAHDKNHRVMWWESS